MKLLYGKYHFICRFEKAAILPDYKGSTFHGVFGRSLKNVVCALKRQTCMDCPLNQRCLYVAVFETNLVRKPENGARYSDIPHPYIIEPPASLENSFESDKTLSCALGLFGEFNKDLPYFICAVERMGKVGLGRRINGSRGSFRLVEVRGDQGIIYTETDGKKNVSDIGQYLTLPESNGVKIDQLVINFATPLRVKHNQRLSRELPFHVLVRAMLRRIAGLMEAYGSGEPDWNFSDLVRKAEAVRTTKAELHWYDWERYSFRQKQRMPMGGIVGSIVYENVPAEFVPLLKFCEKVNVGKNTSFGLGQFSASWHSDSNGTFLCAKAVP